MKPITVSQKTNIKSSVIWKKWKSLQPWNNWDQSSSNLSKGQKGHINSKDRGSAAYEILDVKENESFKIAWKAPFVKLIFKYSVRPLTNSSIITYSVVLKGFFSIPVYFLIKNKIKKNITSGLASFISKLEKN